MQPLAYAFEQSRGLFSAVSCSLQASAALNSSVLSRPGDAAPKDCSTNCRRLMGLPLLLVVNWQPLLAARKAKSEGWPLLNSCLAFYIELRQNKYRSAVLNMLWYRSSRQYHSLCGRLSVAVICFAAANPASGYSSQLPCAQGMCQIGNACLPKQSLHHLSLSSN